MGQVSDELVISTATEDDVQLILQLSYELAIYERMAAEVVATEQGMRDALFGPKRFVDAIVARLGAEPAGFALFFHNFSTFLGRRGIYLEDLFVRPALRGRGIGKALLERLAEIAVERECGRLEWSVLDWNESAIAFYRSVGAVPLDGWTVFRVSGAALGKLARRE